VYLNLSEFDIQNLKLNDKIYLDRAYWNINKVIDYNANANQLTKVELISVDDEIDLPPFDTRTPFTPIDVDITITELFNAIQKTRYESLTSNSAKGGVINLGKNNVILGNIKNAFVIGDNQVISRDGVYVNGVNLLDAISAPISRSIYEATTTYQVLPTDDIVNVNSGTFTITLSDVVGIIGRQHKIKNSGTGVILVDGYLGQKIDTVDDFTLNQYDSITVVSNNGNWIIV
jgi:hypothetical protein